MKLELKIIDLLARNAERKYTINEVAMSLKEYYSFVHRTINKLAEDGVVLKERAGRSYLCSVNLENEKAIALLQLSEIERKNEFYTSNKELRLLLEDFVKSAKSIIKPLSIVLFGSYAKGTAAKSSDVDILLITMSKRGVDKISREIYAKFGKEINVIAMSPESFRKQKDKSLIKEIIKNHYILYGVNKFVNLAFR